MTLVDRQIIERSGMIDGFVKERVVNIGYDLQARKFYAGGIGADELTLGPAESAFVESSEIIHMPNDLLGRISLKNSRIRQGLAIESPVYQPGHKTRIYFRLTNVSSSGITLKAGELYGTISFEKLDAVPDHPYDGAYKNEFDFVGMGEYKNLYQRQMKIVEEKTENLKTIENSIYANVMVILTVFVALFAFVTVNVALAANTDTELQTYFLFNFLLLGGISFLVALVGSILKEKKQKPWIWLPAVLCLGAALLLFLL